MNSKKISSEQNDHWLSKAINFAHAHKFQEALTAIDQALVLNPICIESLINRALILESLNRLDDALDCINLVLKISPKLAPALSVRAAILYEMGSYLDAINSYSLLIEERPNDTDALYNQGVIYAALKDFNNAKDNFSKVTLLNPNYHDAWLNLANTCHELKHYAEAIKIYDRLATEIPDNAQIYINRGNTLFQLKQFKDAANDYLRASQDGLINNFELGIAHHRMMLVCDWSDYDLFCNEMNKGVLENRNVAEPFGYQAIAKSERHLQLCAEIFCAERFPSNYTSHKKIHKQQGGTIRIGYLCGEFGYQATSILMTNIWELHDQNQFEIIGFDNAWSDKSKYRERIESSFSNLINIHKIDDVEAAKIIEDQGIDILVNLNGYFGRERQQVFAMRPAPIQVNFLGFPGTIGADYIDYILADSTVIPEESRKFYTEKVIYLPNCYQPNDSKRIASERHCTKSEFDLPEDQFIFCCFSNNYKISPFIFNLWMKILGSTPNSLIWLLQDSEMAAENLRKEAARAGINPSRLHFAQRLPLAEHLSRHKLADLFLDTLPYTAHTTASDALWMNLPLLTLTGTTFPGRVATSLLKNLNLPELITETAEDYVNTAIEFAQNRVKLLEIKNKLSSNLNTGSLFNAEQFTKNLEHAYRVIFERHQNGLPPDHINICH